jgi:hypothetical protein
VIKNYHKSVFVVLHIALDGVSVVGVYDDYRDADDKRQEEPEKFTVTIAPYYPAPMTEP